MQALSLHQSCETDCPLEASETKFGTQILSNYICNDYIIEIKTIESVLFIIDIEQEECF